MTFWGHSFSFNGTPCEAFDLMMYEFGAASDDGFSIAGTPTIVEDTVNTRYKPLHYGVTYNTKNEVVLTFGVNQRRIDDGKYLDRSEVDEIAAWLTGYDQYKKLEIQQDDMMYVWYNVIATSLEYITYRGTQWALQATFTCDSPYGYMYPQDYSVTLTGTTGTLDIYSESSMNGWYYPIVKISGQSGAVSISATSETPARTMTISADAAGAGLVTIDSENQLILSDNIPNMYQYSTLNKFPRLKRGLNSFTITGNAGMTVTFVCTYPVHIGG